MLFYWLSTSRIPLGAELGPRSLAATGPERVLPGPEPPDAWRGLGGPMSELARASGGAPQS